MNQFDEWRNRYEAMTLEEQVAYHNELEKKYPDQAHYHLEWVKQAFSCLNTEQAVFKPRVLEFGAWKGDLAEEIIKSGLVSHWFGIEICDNAIKNTHCKRPEFTYHKPIRFDWWNSESLYHLKELMNYDIIIATHFIEHLSNQHFEQLINFCDTVPVVYFEAPLSNEGQKWDGYEGTHKLEYGWNQVIEIMQKHGYELKTDFGDGKIFCK